ncbi:MAG: histidine kinase N-terminal 7TM domain-containing protein, partial [Candidatus Korobacteraceae bacterium]
MTRESYTRFVASLLAIVTVAAVAFGYINWRKEHEFEIPYDGVWWVEQGGQLEAKRVQHDGPGEKAGIKVGDVVREVNGQEISQFPDLTRQMYRAGTWNKVNYKLMREDVPVDASVILIPYDRSVNLGLRFIALIYLGIGVYVLLRRWTAPKSTHFYLFCLVSFIFYGFHYTGRLNDFDWIIYWSNVVAELLQPALFLHFVLTYPYAKDVIRRHRWLTAACYFPAAVFLVTHITVIHFLAASEVLRYNLDRLEMSYLTIFFLLATGVLWHTYRQADTPILRQQMKWVTRGAMLAIAPFTLFYVIPYLSGAQATPLMKVSVLSLVFLPLTFGYAIFRYRLIDVDLIFKRGMVYTTAAAAIAAVYFAAVGLAAEIVHTRVPSAGPAGMIVAIVVTALLFDPFKNYIQQRLDRFFYRKRYDYRRTLLEFGRDLSSQLDLDQ